MSARPVGRGMLIAASLLVLATLLAALWAMESPSKQRDRRLDERRVSGLEGIATAVDAWHVEHGRLPVTLTELAGKPGLSLDAADPVSGAPYAYNVLSKHGYRLCAVFATSTADKEAGRTAFERYDQRWLHPVGRHCFERTVKAPVAAAAQAAP